MGKAEDELAKLYKMRVRDRLNYKSRRQKAVDLRPKKVGDLVTSLFKNDPETLKRLEESKALQCWEEFVGSSAARFSTALRIRGGKLVVRVSDPLWMQQLSLLKYELLKKYWKAFPKITLNDIFFTRWG